MFSLYARNMQPTNSRVRYNPKVAFSVSDVVPDPQAFLDFFYVPRFDTCEEGLKRRSRFDRNASTSSMN